MSIERLDLGAVPPLLHQDIIEALPRSTVGALGLDGLTDRLVARPDVTSDDVLQELRIAAYVATDTWEPTRVQIDDATPEIEDAVLDATRPEPVHHGQLERAVPVDNDDFGATDVVFVDTLLSGLPPRQAAVVRARILDDLTFAAVGGRLSMTRSNAQQLFKAAMHTLAEGIEDRTAPPSKSDWDYAYEEALDGILSRYRKAVRRGANLAVSTAHGRLDELVGATADELDDICVGGLGRQIDRLRHAPSSAQGRMRRLMHEQGTISHKKDMRALGYETSDPLAADQEWPDLGSRLFTM